MNHIIVLYCIVLYCIMRSITKNVGAILIQNKDLNALLIIGTMNHIITLSVTQCLSKWHYNYYSVQNRVVYRPQSMQMQHGQ